MQVRILSADDWEGLYIDGELQLEGHSLPLTKVIKLLVPNIDYADVWNDEEEFWAEHGYRCPQKWIGDKNG